MGYSILYQIQLLLEKMNLRQNSYRQVESVRWSKRVRARTPLMSLPLVSFPHLFLPLSSPRLAHLSFSPLSPLSLSHVSSYLFPYLSSPRLANLSFSPLSALPLSPLSLFHVSPYLFPYLPHVFQYDRIATQLRRNCDRTVTRNCEKLRRSYA